MKRVSMVIVAIVLGAAVFISSCGPSSSTYANYTLKSGIKQWSSPPAMTIDQNKQYTATIKTETTVEGKSVEFGDITVQLFPKEAPLAVNNFVFLARQGFYNGSAFHRIIKDFVIQGGDPFMTGAGGPGYKFDDDEPITRDYVPGTLAMANSGPDTNGSQFFITLSNLSDRANPHYLPKNWVIFGIVTGNFDAVQEIGNVDTTIGQDGLMSKPLNDVIIKTITITEK